MPAGPGGAGAAYRRGVAAGDALVPEDGGRGLAGGAAPRPVAHTDVATMTQTMADAFAEGIAEHPEDWHMVQRLWRDDLDPQRARIAGSATPA